LKHTSEHSRSNSIKNTTKKESKMSMETRMVAKTRKKFKSKKYMEMKKEETVKLQVAKTTDRFIFNY
jgi:hypothetical protein